MTLMEDYRKKKDGDDADFLAGADEDKDDDETALGLDGKNPVAEEEKTPEDFAGDE